MCLCVCVTFDDGFEGIVCCSLGIMASHGYRLCMDAWMCLLVSMLRFTKSKWTAGRAASLEVLASLLSCMPVHTHVNESLVPLGQTKLEESVRQACRFEIKCLYTRLHTCLHTCL